MTQAGAAGDGPFDRVLRRRARARAAAMVGRHDFLLRHAAEELAAREAALPPLPEGPVLQLGALAPRLAVRPPDILCDAARAPLGGHRRAVQCDEDRLPFRDDSFALVRSLMVLHGVNDVPGALLLARRVLKPGGWLLAVLVGGLALTAVRRAFVEAELGAGAGVAVRVGPSIDPAEAGGLLQRAGFADPVVEVERVTARYRRLRDFARDARGMGETGWLAARSRRPAAPGAWAAAEARFETLREADGKVPVAADLLYLSARRA